jgi:pyruvate/2-oxoglutarate/acetoin dehydrogenase E1 component
VGVAGLKVVAPASVADAYGLLRAAIDDDDPVLYFEHKGLYRRLRGELPEPDYRVPLGRARVARPGRDATIVTYSAGVDLALRATEALDVEVLDLRTLWPYDADAVLASLEKTSRLLVLQEAPRSSGVAGHLLSLAAREGFELLDAPPAVVAPPDTPVPFAPALETAYLPSVESLRAALEDLLAY